MWQNFGGKLKKVRQERKLSQRNLGVFLGLSDKAISSYESGRTLPNLEVLMKISKELEKPASYFLDEDLAQESLVDRLNEIEIQIKNISENLKEIKKNLSETEEDPNMQVPSVVLEE